MKDWTTITVSPEMRDRLKALKRGGETYSDMLERELGETLPALDEARKILGDDELEQPADD